MDSLPISAPERYPSRRGRPDLPAPRASPLHLGDHPAVDCRGSELQGQRRLHSDERRPLGRCQGPAPGARILPTAVRSSAGPCSLVLATDGLPRFITPGHSPAAARRARTSSVRGIATIRIALMRSGLGRWRPPPRSREPPPLIPKKRRIGGTQRMIPLAAVVPTVYECALATGGDP